MKILHLTEYFYPFAHGGTEWSVYYLLQGLIKSGHEIFLLTPNYGSSAIEMWKGIPIIRFPFLKKMNATQPKTISPIWHNNPFTWFVTLIYLLKAVNKEKIEIIHVQSKSMILPAIFIQWLRNIPVIITLRDYYPLCSYGLCLTSERKYKRCNTNYLFTKELRNYIQIYAPRSNKIFHYTAAIYSRIISSLLRFFIRKARARVCISKKMQEIYTVNGIWETQVIYNSMLFQNKLSYSKPQQSVLFVGRLTPGKGVHLFIEAIKETSKKYPKMSWEILGEGFLRKLLEQQLLRERNKTIHFFGQLDYDQTLKHIKESLVVVVPSVWEEPFGRVALEALSIGVPVVATKRGGLPEIIDSGKTGYTVNPEKKALEKGIEKAILNNKKLRENIKLKHDDLVRTFSVRPVYAYIQLYQKCKIL